MTMAIVDDDLIAQAEEFMADALSDAITLYEDPLQQYDQALGYLRYDIGKAPATKVEAIGLAMACLRIMRRSHLCHVVMDMVDAPVRAPAKGGG